MTILDFDQAQLARDLDSLPRDLRIAFAAACAERLRPAYLAFSACTGQGNPVAFEAILSGLWNALDMPSRSDESLAQTIELCMALIPHAEDEPWVDERAYAEDAGTALAYALRCQQNGEGQEAALAAEHGHETLDQYVVRHENIDRTAPGAEARILKHPLIQAELLRQQRDLEDLRAAGANPKQVIVAIHERAKRDAPYVFKVLS